MRNKKHLISAVILSLLITISFAHSGRTDSSGGHKDNKNVSGLGSYHYHCGGYPAHLHTNGICPYTSPKITYPTTPVAPIKPIVPTTPAVETQVALSTKMQVDVPTYAVKINGQDISNFSMGWKPFVYENITYIPMTSYLVNALNLQLNFSNENGFNLSAKQSDYSEYFYVYETIVDLKDGISDLRQNFIDAYSYFNFAYYDRNYCELLETISNTAKINYDFINLIIDRQATVTNYCVKHDIATEQEIKDIFNIANSYNYYQKTTIDKMLNNALRFDYTDNFVDDSDLSRTNFYEILNKLNEIKKKTSIKF